MICFVCFYPPALWSHVICDVLPSSCFSLLCAAPSPVCSVFSLSFFVVVVFVFVVVVLVLVVVEWPVRNGSKSKCQ